MHRRSKGIAMKVFTVVIVLALGLLSGAFGAKCEGSNEVELSKMSTAWIDMNKNCVDAVRNHIQRELEASITYLSMAAHFSRHSVNKLGFAKMFFQSADEEREHAMKLIDYLLWRGELTENISEIIKMDGLFKVKKSYWGSGWEAMNDALELEAQVTDQIKNVIQVCELCTKNCKKHANDYHLVDYLTSDFLQEQNEGERELATKISKLAKLKTSHKELSEWMFDKELLK